MSQTGERTTDWRRRREALGLSLSEVARRAGLNKGRVSIIERGWPPKSTEAEAMARVLREAETAAQATP